MKKSGFTLIELITSIIIIGVVVVLICQCIGGCRQIAAKHYGGTYTVKLDPGMKLVNCTWKESQLWLLTTKRSDTEEPKVHKFIEKSTLGILQGEVTIEEK